MKKIAFAVGSHPDDIEFMMAGTLLLLKRQGYEIHYMNVANGSCGTDELDAAAIVKVRRGESMAAAEFAGAVHHESLSNDLEVFYERELLFRLGAVMREVNPDVVLTHYPFDYMEDHSNTCRLAVTAAFCRGMRNFPVEPWREPVAKDVALYHAMPYGLTDPLGGQVTPDLFVDVSSVMETKKEMLARHQSQKKWLDVSQGMDSYIISMEDMMKDIGARSAKLKFAEAWVRHAHWGFSRLPEDIILRDLPEATTHP